MVNIYEILQRAASLKEETVLNSISPERAGGIMYDTLLALNDLWLQQGSALVISKIYASVAAMEADTAPVSDLTGKPLRPGQIVVIASSDSDNGSVYRYNGTDAPSWSLVGAIGNLTPVDSLDSDSTQLPLAAHQGKVLDGKISQLGQQIDGKFQESFDDAEPTITDLCIPAGHVSIRITNRNETYASIIRLSFYDKYDNLVAERIGGTINAGATAEYSIDTNADIAKIVYVQNNNFVKTTLLVQSNAAILGKIKNATSQLGYFECATQSYFANKVVNANNFILTIGGAVKIKFVSENEAASPTLNINGTGAYPLYYNGVIGSAKNTWDAGEIVEVFFDGTYYQARTIEVKNVLANVGYYVCSSVGGATSKSITIPDYVKSAYGTLKVRFVNRNISPAPVTLKINDVEKPLYYNGNVVSETNSWLEGEIVSIYTDGTNFYAEYLYNGEIVEKTNRLVSACEGSLKIPFGNTPTIHTYIPKGNVHIKLTNNGNVDCIFGFTLKDKDNNEVASFISVLVTGLSYSEFNLLSKVDIYKIVVTSNNNLMPATFEITSDGGLLNTQKETNERLIELYDIVGCKYDEHLFTPDEYVDLLFDTSQNKIVTIAASNPWKSCIVPIQAGMTYMLKNANSAHLTTKYPVAGLTLGDDVEAVTYPGRFTIPKDSDRNYLLVGVYANENNTSMSSYLDGYVEITEYKNKGLALGDSNVQGTGVGVGLGEDAPTIMGAIMGATMDNGGIGGTSYADDEAISFNRVAEALVSRDFTTIDSGIEGLLEEYPTWTFLQDRWARIKTTPLSEYNFILIAYGTNDFASGRTLDNDNDKFDVTTILGSLRYGIKKILEASPATRIYVVTPAYRYGLGGSNDNDSDNYQINGKYLWEIGNAIFDACKELHIPCLNYYYTSGSNKYNKAAILQGGTHRTRYGYRLMAEQYVKFVLSY